MATAARWSLLAVVLLGFAYAWPVQPLGCNQTAHYALTKSLASGAPQIDPYQRETCDKSWIDGHFYAAKPPGLAFASTPPYVVLDAVGAVPDDPRTTVWLLGLATVVLPGTLLLALVRRRAGTAAALTLGLATLVLPFSTLYFSHVLAATLGFAAFALLSRERLPLALCAAAGALAGYAVTSEFPLVIVAGALGLYLLARVRRVRPLLAYGTGIAVGLAPLAAYNLWAFGSLTQNVYENAVIHAGQSGHDVVGANATGFFGVEAPSARVALELLFTEKGLLVTAPVLAAAVAGLVLLARRGKRAEAFLAGGIALAYLVYNAGYYLPFGGDVPGPRFLVPALPFLALGLGAAYRSFPGATVALALPSALILGTATLTEPMLGHHDTGVWFDRAAAGDFTETVATLAGAGHGWLAVAPLVAAALAAAAVAWRADARGLPPRRQLETGVAALAAWGVVGSAGPALLGADGQGVQFLGAVALVLIVSVLALVVFRVDRHGVSYRFRGHVRPAPRR